MLLFFSLLCVYILLYVMLRIYISFFEDIKGDLYRGCDTDLASELHVGGCPFFFFFYSSSFNVFLCPISTDTGVT